MDSRPVTPEPTSPKSPTFPQEWSPENKYIVYYFSCDKEDQPSRKLIGFIDDPDKANSIPWETGKKIVIRQLSYSLNQVAYPNSFENQDDVFKQDLFFKILE